MRSSNSATSNVTEESDPRAFAEQPDHSDMVIDGTNNAKKVLWTEVAVPGMLFAGPPFACRDQRLCQGDSARGCRLLHPCPESPIPLIKEYTLNHNRKAPKV